MRTYRVSIRKTATLNGTPVAYPQEDIDRIKQYMDSMLEDIHFAPRQIQNASVILNPNLVRPNLKTIPASSTDPRVVLAAAELFADYGASSILVGENPGFGFSGRQAFSDAGLLEPLKKRGFQALFFDEGEWLDVPNPSGRLYRSIRVAKPVMDADLFINLPKWKTHMLTGVSLSIKNLLGIIHDDQRMLFHRNDIIEKIVDLAMVRAPDLNIVDGLWAMEGQAPFHGLSIENYNGIVMGTDMVSVDETVAGLMGFEQHEIPHIMVARERLWQGNDHTIDLVGSAPEQLARRFKRPVLSSAGQFTPARCIECGVCNGCLSAIRHSLDKLAFESGKEAIPPVTIISGRPMCNEKNLESVDGDLILFGNCAAEFQFYTHANRQQGTWIPGCPPHVLDLADLLRSRCQVRDDA
jgi:uncharacterized protein (DUF362 family)